jgi:hypothetical protein
MEYMYSAPLTREWLEKEEFETAIAIDESDHGFGWRGLEG